MWDYFNHNRLVRATSGHFNPTELHSFQVLADLGILDHSGALVWKFIRDSGGQQLCMYAGDMIQAGVLYNYFADIVDGLIRSTGPADLGLEWTPDRMRSVAQLGRVVFLTAPFRFKSHPGVVKGPHQIRRGYYAKDGVRLEFEFDGWETTTHTSYERLRRISRVTAVCVVRSAYTKEEVLTVEAACLAIGTGFRVDRPMPVSISHKSERRRAVDDDVAHIGALTDATTSPLIHLPIVDAPKPTRGASEISARIDGWSAEDAEASGDRVNRPPQYCKRAVWLQARLRERSWNKNDLAAQGGPDRKTVQKILDGGPVREDVIEKVASALSQKYRKVNVLEIPDD